jgi:hypothetical protein
MPHRIELWVAELDHDHEQYAQHVEQVGDNTIHIVLTGMIGCALSFASEGEAEEFCMTYEGFHARGVFFNRDYLS